ncbi:hypothetical protein BS78_01G332100 [Paspalum vaginatum]|nr:hypothetical protein BS78_01G332100 [Paspalum vaginatum]
MSDGATTHSLDTSTGMWKDLGEWALPFTGQAFFDADLDAWVGLRRSRYRAASVAVCCCPVVSRSAVATRPPRCTMLKEDGDDRLIRRGEDDPMYRPWVRGTTLTYMGDSRFALVENVLRGKNATDGAVLHVTLFGLMYDQTGELRTKAHRATRSYAVSKHTTLFSHAAFWM